MKSTFVTSIVLAAMAISVSFTDAAITIRSAKVYHGLAVVHGGEAIPGADIFWEGVRVTHANKHGKFSFSGVVPPDCIGTLSDGTLVEVALHNCTPIALAPAPVPQTGQTTTYAVGDDGAIRAGVALPSPRFTDNGNGTITDNLTGLIWLKNANCIGVSYPGFDQVGTVGDGAVNWQNALDFVAGINAGTYDCGDTSGEGGTHRTDWRLPNIRELFSLIDFAFFNPAVSNAAGTGNGSGSDPFSNLALSSNYLSSTTIARIPNGMFFVHFSDGMIAEGNKTGPHIGFVIGVRGGS
jgi:hypothetical protein